MLSKHFKSLTPSLLNQVPYSFDIIWNKDNYLLIKLNKKELNTHDTYMNQVCVEKNVESKMKTLLYNQRQNTLEALNQKGYF